MNPASVTANHRQILLWLLQLLVCGAGVLLLWYATNWGVAISPDSAEYLAAARRLHSFADLFKLPTQWAPGYPMLLKLGFLSGLEIPAATRVLQGLLLAANLAAGMAVLRHVCGKQSLWPLLGGVVLLCSFNLWQVNFYAWSEGPFLLCQQLSLLYVLRFLEAPAMFRHLLAAALLAALALMFRYAGIAWAGTAALVLLMQPAAPWQQRVRNAFAFGIVAVLPFLVWIVANHFVRHETTNREFVVHLVSGSDLLTLLMQILSWFGLTRTGPLGVTGLVLTVTVVWLALRAFSRTSARLHWLTTISACHAVVYTLFIIFSKSFLDAYIPFDERIFVSAWLFTLLLVLACAIRLMELGRRTQLVAVIAMAFTAASGILQVVPMVNVAHQQGVGYLSAYMTQLSRVQEVPQLVGRTVYTNGPDYLRMQTDLEIHDYPRKFAPTTQLTNQDYSKDLESMRHNVETGGALLVHYQVFEWRSYFPAMEELNALGYQTVLAGNGVQILSFPVDRPVDGGAQ